MRRLRAFSRLPQVRTVVTLVCLSVIFGLLAGCGGGGGTRGCVGVSTPSDLNYRTEWSGPLGNSQVIQLLSEGGTVLQSRILNRGVNEISFNQTNSGLYRMRAELRSSINGAGPVVGRVETAFEVCGTTVFNTRTSGSPSGMTVYPSSISLIQNATQRFYASPTNAQGEHFFTSTGEVEWTISGGAATVDDTGLVTATNAGNATLRATDVASTATGVANITVSPFAPTRSKWTILVFLNAANDLHPFSTLNVNQMERVANNPDLRFVVQWKQARSVFPSSTFDGTRRLLVRPDNTDAIESPTLQNMELEVDMGNWNTLRDFIAWGKANYPADRYGLVIWNHGNGWQRGIEPPTRAVSYDDQTGNAIQIWQLPSALSGGEMDFVAWDASLMQMMEVAYEIRDHTDFIVGSEESPPGAGYPYDLVFDPFRDNPNLSTRQLTKGFVDGMVNYSPYNSSKITQSVLEAAKLNDVATALDNLARELIAAGGTVNAVVQSARLNSQSYSPTPQRAYRDLWDVAELIRTSAGVSPAIAAAALQVQNAVEAAVVWEAHNANSPRSRGLAIDFSSGGTFTSISSDYNQLDLATNTRWDNWLRVAP